MVKRILAGVFALALVALTGCSLVGTIDDPECWPYGRTIPGDLSSDCRAPEGGEGSDGGGAGAGAGDSGDSGEGEGPGEGPGEGEGPGDSGEGEGEGEGEGQY